MKVKFKTKNLYASLVHSNDCIIIGTGVLNILQIGDVECNSTKGTHQTD